LEEKMGSSLSCERSETLPPFWSLSFSLDVDDFMKVFNRSVLRAQLG